MTLNFPEGGDAVDTISVNGELNVDIFADIHEFEGQLMRKSGVVPDFKTRFLAATIALAIYQPISVREINGSGSKTRSRVLN